MLSRPPAYRVALFTEIFEPVINGVVMSIESLASALRANGDDAIIIAPWQPGARERADVMRTISLPLPTSSGYRLVVPWWNARAAARARRIDVVHAHSPFVSGEMAAAFAQRVNAPLIFTYHTRLEAYAHYAPFAPNVTRAFVRARTRAFANRAATVIVPTQAIADDLRAIGVRAPIAVVPSAIDVERVRGARRDDALRARAGASANTRIVLVVARLAREKNVALAVDALRSLDDVRLVIVGDGPERASLAARAQQHGVATRVHFTGALDPAQVAQWYASADAFAFTSTTETQGLVLAEALAAGLPLAAVDGAVAREIAGPHAAYAPSEPAAFAAALRAALAPDRPRPPREALRRFEPATVAAAVRAVYERAQSAVHLAL